MTVKDDPKLFKRAKILATIGPTTDSYDHIEDMFRAGVNGFRLNFSHGKAEEHYQRLEWVRKASKKFGRQVAVVQDLQGPKIRLGDFEGTVNVHEGQHLTLSYKEHDKGELPIQYDLSQKVKMGERLYLFDGRVRSVVLHVEEQKVTVRIENDGVLMQRKGINLPDTDFGGDVITKKDIADLISGSREDIDYVAMSFVQTRDDVVALKALLAEHGSNAKVIAKIETQAAIDDRNLEAIIIEADGVMVARGDLAIETSPEIVPIVQRKILELAQRYGKLSIVATQMLGSMTTSPQATRAEVSDVANAVIMGADCLMLSEETAQGRYPIEAIETMRRIILYTQTHAPLRPLFYSETNSSMQDAISSAVVTLAHQIGAQAIICETKSGTTARSIAAHRPAMPIISVTSVPRVAHQLAIMYGNRSFLHSETERSGWEIAKQLAESQFLQRGMPVVLVSGRQPGLTGGTDTIRVRVVE